MPLLSRLRSFCFPAGEDSARSIRAIRSKQRGEMRMSPDARWIPFTAEEFVGATRSHFRWEARVDPGKFGSPTVIDSYEEGHGFLAVKLGGILPVKKITGPAADRGELQRYLASVAFCPAMLINHGTLEVSFVEPDTLRLRDQQDETGAAVDLALSADGQPIAVRAIRPRVIGKRIVDTPWSGTVSEFRDYEGLRIATRLEASWHPPEGEFPYFREEITSFEVLA